MGNVNKAWKIPTVPCQSHFLSIHPPLCLQNLMKGLSLERTDNSTLPLSSPRKLVQFRVRCPRRHPLISTFVEVLFPVPTFSRGLRVLVQGLAHFLGSIWLQPR